MNIFLFTNGKKILTVTMSFEKRKTKKLTGGINLFLLRVTQKDDTGQSCRSEATTGWHISSQGPRGSYKVPSRDKAMGSEDNSVPIPSLRICWIKNFAQGLISTCLWRRQGWHLRNPWRDLQEKPGGSNPEEERGSQWPWV